MQARPLALVACVLGTVSAAATAVVAQDKSCRSFSWSVGRTIDLFDEPLPVLQDAQSVPKEGAFALLLKPVADVIYHVAPERGSDGGIVTIENIPAGRYHIALSAEAWVDAVQDNHRLAATNSGTADGCPGVHRSFDVEVKGEPLTLQFGGAVVRRISIAVVRIWPFEWRW